MDDDFNTALAIGNVFELVRSVNRVLAEGKGPAAVLRGLLAEARAEIAEAGQVLGIFGSAPSAYLERIRDRKLADMGLTSDAIEALIGERTAARKAKDFARSDAIRDQLLAQGVALLDSAQGTTWKVK
jgi:cysteinyl-tRNA synthetase